MSRSLLFTPLLLATLASSALAQGTLHIAWDQCAGSGGGSLRAFACATNADDGADANMVVCSYVPDMALPVFVSASGLVRVSTPGPTPSWWGVDCAGKSDATLFLTSPGGACGADAFAGLGATGGISSVTYAGYAGRPPADPYGYDLDLALAFVLPTGVSTDLVSGTEYALFTVQVSNLNTVGAGACDGCSSPARLTFENATIQYGTSGDGRPFFALPIPTPSSPIYWQSDQPVPARASTWGAIKSLYR